LYQLTVLSKLTFNLSVLINDKPVRVGMTDKKSIALPLAGKVIE